MNKKLFPALFFLLIGLPVALATDSLFSDGTSGRWMLQDNNGTRWNASVGYTTNGNGDIYTLGGLLASDSVIGDATSGNHQLIDNNSKRWNLNVLYTTDGAGNVIPITGGGGGGGGISSVAGTYPLVVVSPTTTPTVKMAGFGPFTVLAGPPSPGPSAAPSPRLLVGGDLPNPTSSSLGGVQSKAAVTSNFLTSISTSGVPAAAQPACSDLSNGAASCSTDTTNAANIASGLLDRKSVV